MRQQPLRVFIAFCCIALIWVPARALDPSRHVSQYGHTVWRLQDGIFDGAPYTITQFINYVFDDPQAWGKMPERTHQDMLQHAREWDVILTIGKLFPPLSRQAVRKINVPVLLLSGERSYGLLGLIDADLTELLPHAQRILLRGATHQMWIEQPENMPNGSF